MSSLLASTKLIGSKATEKKWRHRFPHYKSMGAFCCHGNQSFDPICPKTLCSLSPTPVMLLIKFDQDWLTGFRDIKVWKCGRRRTTTDSGPLVYYKLTLWAFGSGELKSINPTEQECIFLLTREMQNVLIFVWSVSAKVMIFTCIQTNFQFSLGDPSYPTASLQEIYPLIINTCCANFSF